MTRLALFLLLLAPITASAEPTPLRWSSHPQIAGWISDALVGVNLTLDTVATFKAEDKSTAAWQQACRMGVAMGATEALKRLVHRTRPDGSDNLSFPSGHTAAAMASSGWRVGFGVPVAIGTAYGRQAAGKHYLTDVLTGAGLGLLSEAVCGRIGS